MQTFNIEEAARFLKMHKDTVQAKAKAGGLPGAKVGRAWVFVDVDLIQYIRAQYRQKTDIEGNPWGSQTQVVRADVNHRSKAAIDAAYEKALRPAPRERKPV